MYDEIFENLEKQLSRDEIERIRNKNIHLGIFSEPYLSYMLNGQKTIESRFSKKQIAPYHKIKQEDIVLVKKASGKILGYFTIKNVFFFDLKVTSITDLKVQYGRDLCVDDTFWNLKKDSNYATLIVIDQIVNLKPFSINKKGMQTWIQLNPKL